MVAGIVEDDPVRILIFEYFLDHLGELLGIHHVPQDPLRLFVNLQTHETGFEFLY